MAVYVPTNHLYLGDIVVYPRDRAFFPDLTVEEGIRIFLTGGMSLPSEIRRTEAGRSGQTFDDRDRRPTTEQKRGAMRAMREMFKACGPGGGAGRAAAGAGAGDGRWRSSPKRRRRQPGRRRAGGEVNLVLPDLALTDVGGYNGRTLLMIGLVRVGRSACSSGWSS